MAPMVYRLLLSHAAAAAAVLLLLPLSATATNFEYCDKAVDYPVKVNSIQICRDPINPFKPTTFNISANTRDEMLSGGLIADFQCPDSHRAVHHLCEMTTCPVSVGDFTLLFEDDVQGVCCKVIAQLFNQDNVLVTCFIFNVPFGV